MSIVIIVCTHSIMFSNVVPNRCCNRSDFKLETTAMMTYNQFWTIKVISSLRVIVNHHVCERLCVSYVTQPYFSTPSKQNNKKNSASDEMVSCCTHIRPKTRAMITNRQISFLIAVIKCVETAHSFIDSFHIFLTSISKIVSRWFRYIPEKCVRLYRRCSLIGAVKESDKMHALHALQSGIITIECVTAVLCCDVCVGWWLTCNGISFWADRAVLELEQCPTIHLILTTTKQPALSHTHNTQHTLCFRFEIVCLLIDENTQQFLYPVAHTVKTLVLVAFHDWTSNINIWQMNEDNNEQKKKTFPNRFLLLNSCLCVYFDGHLHMLIIIL